MNYNKQNSQLIGKINIEKSIANSYKSFDQSVNQQKKEDILNYECKRMEELFYLKQHFSFLYL